MLSDKEIQFQRQQIARCRRELTHYLYQKSQYVEEVPPSELTEHIRFILEEIQAIKEILHDWDVPIDDRRSGR